MNSQAGQVSRGKLHVKDVASPHEKVRSGADEGDFGRIRLSVELALCRVESAEHDSVQPADEVSPLPNFVAQGVTKRSESRIGLGHL